MKNVIKEKKRETGLIRVTHAARERYEVSKYFYENRGREYAGHCVIQRTLEGNAFLELEGLEYKVPMGSAMAFVHGEDSSYGWDPLDSIPYVLEWIGFAGGNSVALLNELRERLGPVFSISASSEAYLRFSNMQRRVKTMDFRDRYEAAEEMYALLMALFRLELSSEEGGDLCTRASYIIRNEFTSPINVQTVAGRLDCSREHLTRLYAERFGESPAAALRRLRIKHAAELLAVTSLSVSEVGYRSGMREVNTFHRAFKRVHGMGPQQYRETLRPR